MSAEQRQPSPAEAGNLRGHLAIDTNGQPVGKVTDVLFDDRTGTPEWAIVDTGLLRPNHYVPLVDAYQTNDGRVVLHFDRGTVKQSPRVGRDHVLTPEAKHQLRHHYDVAS